MEHQNNPKEAEKPETAPTSSSPAAAAAESPPTSPPPPPPPSLSSSPTHEFSFTISFHAPNSLSGTTSAAATAVKLSKSSSYPLDFDLSPADDIFFNGHLLPLHFVSHRPSDVSIHNTNFLPHSHIEADEASNTAGAGAASVSTSEDYKVRSSHRSFPLFWLRKWLKGNDGEENRVDDKQRNKRTKKKVFDFALLWKKYTNLVEPLIFLKGWKEKRQIRRSTQFSFSGHSQRRRWQGESSAPASIRTSPPNSGLLVTPSTNNFSSEELQNAIQAAIVHCKNSIAVEED